MNNTENSRPVVSIWCLVYNHEHYIERCLKGFVMQKTNFIFEAIIHDDASTDRSADIIRQYATKYPTIIKPILETENQYSKNIGALETIMKRSMRGKYIAICEGDDYWTDPNKLQKQFDYLENHPSVNIAVHNAVCLYSDGRSELFNKHIKTGVYNIRKCLRMKWFTPTASYLYRNNFELSTLWSEKGCNGDMAILFSNLMLGDLYYSDETMSVYNIGTPNSMTSSTSRVVLYKKKRRMYKTVNELSGNKFLLTTLPLELKLYIKQIIFMVLNWIQIK